MSERGPEDVPMAMWPEVEVIAGAAAALAALSGVVPLAIATNASVSRRPMIERALRRVGFADYFDKIFCYTELGYRKDQREFWGAVERGLGTPLANIAMVGDSYVQDAYFPSSFGAQGVWFNEGGQVQRSDVVTPVVEALPAFAEWAANAA